MRRPVPTMRIVNTAGDTLYGEIVRSALQGAHGRTPLQQAIARLLAFEDPVRNGVAEAVRAAQAAGISVHWSGGCSGR